MTWDQYWYGDVWMVVAFQEADRLRQERQNNEAWLQGIYFRKAIESLCPIPVFFADVKKMQESQYPAEPYQFREKEEAEQVDEEIIEKKKAQVRGLQAMLFG